jgi:hypothetical protein
MPLRYTTELVVFGIPIRLPEALYFSNSRFLTELAVSRIIGGLVVFTEQVVFDRTRGIDNPRRTRGVPPNSRFSAELAVSTTRGELAVFRPTRGFPRNSR